MALSERENRDWGNNMTTNSRAFNDLTRLTIDIDLFQNPFGVLYFDLRNQKEELKSGSTKLELKCILSTTPNAEYNMFALILHEEEISVDVIFRKVCSEDCCFFKLNMLDS